MVEGKVTMNTLHRLPEQVSALVFARLVRAEGTGEWQCVGTAQRRGDQVSVVFDGRGAMCAPLWAAVPANDNAGMGRIAMRVEFAAQLPSGELAPIGERALHAAAMRRMAATANARQRACRQGLRGRAHRELASNWPEASRLRPSGKKLEEEEAKAQS